MEDKKESKTREVGKIPIYKWETLSCSQKEFGVIFKQELYRIRLTKNGKLIMNK